MSSASRLYEIGPPGWTVRPEPRKSGMMTRKCFARVSIWPPYDDSHPAQIGLVEIMPFSSRMRGSPAPASMTWMSMPLAWMNRPIPYRIEPP